jgi:hypothetical protein
VADFARCPAFTPRYVLLVETFTNLCLHDVAVTSSAAMTHTNQQHVADNSVTTTTTEGRPRSSGGARSSGDMKGKKAAQDREVNKGDDPTRDIASSTPGRAGCELRSPVHHHRSANFFVHQKRMLTKLLSDIRDVATAAPANLQTLRHHATSRSLLALAAVCACRQGLQRLIWPTRKLSFTHLLAKLVNAPRLPTDVLAAVLQGYLALLRVPPAWFPMEFDGSNDGASPRVLQRHQFVEQVSSS